MHTFTEKVFHCLDIPTSFAIGAKSHSGFEGFIFCPHCPVGDLECSFSAFGGEERQLEQLVGIVEGLWCVYGVYIVSDSRLVYRGNFDFGI